MRVTTPLVALAAVAWAGCQSRMMFTDASESPDAAVCTMNCITPSFRPPPALGGGGPVTGFDGGTPSGDGGVVTVTGSVQVSSVVPITRAAGTLVPANGWRVIPLGTTGGDTPVLTADGGLFAIDNVPVIEGGFRLQFAPSTGGELGMVVELDPRSAMSLPVVALSTTALAASGLALRTGAAHLLVEVRNLSGTPVRGMSLDFADGTTATIAYDSDLATTLVSEPPTGARGTIVAYNIAVPVGGSLTVVPRLTNVATGGQAPYRVTLLPDHVTWLPASPP